MSGEERRSGANGGKKGRKGKEIVGWGGVRWGGGVRGGGVRDGEEEVLGDGKEVRGEG